MSALPHPRDRRRITVEVSSKLYAAVVVAKLVSGRTINDLTREGLELMAERYRRQRRAERAVGDPSVSSNNSGDPQ